MEFQTKKLKTTWFLKVPKDEVIQFDGSEGRHGSRNAGYEAGDRLRDHEGTLEEMKQRFSVGATMERKKETEIRFMFNGNGEPVKLQLSAFQSAD